MQGSPLHLDELAQQFQEIKPPLSQREAVLEANRCLYCFDAPCIAACPTSIDVPTFIKKIATGNVFGSAKTILEANLVGATCSRVCPVEELCEGACVLNSDHQPIQIGRLQRYAMDYLYEKDLMPFEVAAPKAKKVAVVGAGPAGLVCAGELAKKGYDVTIFEKRSLPGGLSTYGIVVMREPIRVALSEVAFIQKLGVKLQTEVEVGVDISAEKLLADYDAIFLAVGMGQVPDLGIVGEEAKGVTEALSFIAETKLAEKEGLERLSKLPIGKEVAVIGAGNTAIDAATIAKRLGAERVTIVYRRSDKEMPAYDFEYEFIKNEGVEFRFLSQPVEVLHEDGWVKGLRCVKMKLGELGADGRRGVEASDESFVLSCDQVIKAIGQEKLSLAQLFSLETDRGYIKADETCQSSNPKVFAGGDCIRAKGAAMTVTAARDGKIAANAIHTMLTQ
ncbi:MAG: NAD(P)-dependent oxidoreductase [Deinococcales bacterium]